MHELSIVSHVIKIVEDIAEKQYLIPTWIVGSAEYVTQSEAMFAKYPKETYQVFNYEGMIPFGKQGFMLPPGGAGFGMHVVPVEKAIDRINEKIPAEKISRWMDMYDKFCLL